MRISLAPYLGFLRGVLFRDRPIYAHYAITHACNLRCSACSTWRLAGRTRELSLAEIGHLADVLSRLGCVQVSLSGGEPAMREDLPQIVGIFQEAGIRPRVLTNGVAMTPEVADGLLATGMREVSFSLDSLDPEVQESLDSAKGTFDKRIDNLLHLAGVLPRRNVVPLLNTIVQRKNIEELPRIAELAERIGFFVSFIPLHQPATDEAGHRFYQRTDHLRFRPEDEARVREIYDRLIERKSLGKPIINSTAFLKASPDFFFKGAVDWPCAAGILYLSIAPDGRISPCHAFEHEWDFPYEDFGRTFFSDDYRKTLPSKIEKCEGCFRPCWAETSYMTMDFPSLWEMVKIQARARGPRPRFESASVREFIRSAGRQGHGGR